MDQFSIDRETARLIVLQRIELIGANLKKIRKLFGRRFFTNFVTKFFLNPKVIGKKYYEIMNNEFHSIKDYMQYHDYILKSFLMQIC